MRALRRCFWLAYALSKCAAPTRSPFSSARTHSTTCQLRPLIPSQRRVSRGVLSLVRRRSTRARHLHAPCRAGCGRHATCRKALHRREVSLLRCAPVVRRASCGFQHQASAAFHSAQARLRSLSLGRRRSTQAFCARAPCRVRCGRTTPYRRAPPRREASLLRRTTVARRASCSLQHQASAACLACVSRPPARSLSRGRRFGIQAYRARALAHYF